MFLVTLGMGGQKHFGWDCRFTFALCMHSLQDNIVAEDDQSILIEMSN